MGGFLGLVLGLGLFFVWRSCWDVVAAPVRARKGPIHRVQVHLRETLAQAGLPGTKMRALVGLSAFALAIVFFAAWIATASPLISAPFALIAGLSPYLLVASLARRRQTVLREVWPEVVDHLGSGIRAGLSLPEALGALGDRGPDALRPPFKAFADDFRSSGDFAGAIDALKARLADPVGDRLVESLRITREVGGTDLGTLLRTLSGFLREEARTRGELEARQSWTVNAARLSLAAPWIVLALMATRPEAIAAYNSTGGTIVVVGGAVLSVGAYRIMLRIARLPQDERVLR